MAQLVVSEGNVNNQLNLWSPEEDSWQKKDAIKNENIKHNVVVSVKDAR